MVTLNHIPKPVNSFFDKPNYEYIIDKNAKFKGFCKYFIVNELKEKCCSKYFNLCSDNKECKIKGNTLQNVL